LSLQTWLAWIASHIGLGSIKNVTGVRKDLVDTKKAKLEIEKLEDEAERRDALVVPATFEDVKTFDPKFKEINQKALVMVLESDADTVSQKIERVVRLIWTIVGQLWFLVFMLYEITKLLLYVLRFTIGK